VPKSIFLITHSASVASKQIKHDRRLISEVNVSKGSNHQCLATLMRNKTTEFAMLGHVEGLHIQFMLKHVFGISLLRHSSVLSL
jgi:hypothetical protein